MSLVGFDARVPGVTAVPDRATLRVGFDPLSVKATFPLTDPEACGVKVTTNVVLCPGAKESGKVIPLRLNPEPVTLACDTVKLAPPVLLSVPD